jgi:signal transduction histidine kinase
VIARLRALFSKKDAPSEAVDLNEATREVIALSLSKLHRNRIVLRLDLADDLPLVTSDRVQIRLSRVIVAGCGQRSMTAQALPFHSRFLTGPAL